MKAEDEVKLTANLRKDLLERVNPDVTKCLPGFLALYVGVRVFLSSKDRAR